MRIIDKNNREFIQNKFLSLTLIILISSISIYLGIGVYIYMDFSSYNLDLGRYYWWDSDDCVYTGEREFKDFYQEEVNWSFLEKRAQLFENWTDTYHICNESWDCATTLTERHFTYGLASPFYNDSWNYKRDFEDFNTNDTSLFRQTNYVNPIGGWGDSPMWTGNYMASLAFHYGVAIRDNDIEQANQVLQKIKRPVDGLHVLTHVTGLDGNLARFAIKDTKENRARFVSFFYKMDENGEYTIEREFGREDNKYPGQGEYEGWWYQSRTSRDQHIGTFFGGGITYKLLKESEDITGLNIELREEILTSIKNDASDVLECLIGSNWHVINGEEEIGEGRGHDEASLLPRIPWTSGGDIILGFLAFGKKIDEKKYSSHYTEILNRFLATSYHFSADQSGSYFANNLGFESMLLAYFMDEDKEVRARILLHFENDFYPYIRYHRNSFFNLGWLILNGYDLDDDILQEEKLEYILDDITDNLNRFATWRCPSRSWYIPEVEDAEDLTHPKMKAYSQIFAKDSNHILNLLYGWLFNEFASPSEKSSFALGVDELGSTDFIWQRSPFSISGTHADNEGTLGYTQNAGVDYTLPYWMGRYFEYFKEG